MKKKTTHLGALDWFKGYSNLRGMEQGDLTVLLYSLLYSLNSLLRKRRPNGTIQTNFSEISRGNLVHSLTQPVASGIALLLCHSIVH